MKTLTVLYVHTAVDGVQMYAHAMQERAECVCVCVCSSRDNRQTESPLGHHLTVGGDFPLEPDVSLGKGAGTLDDPSEPSMPLTNLQQRERERE